LLNDDPDLSEIKDEMLVDMLTHMFEKNPKKRPEMGEIAMHSWLTKSGKVPMMLYDNNEISEASVEKAEQVQISIKEAARSSFNNKVDACFSGTNKSNSRRLLHMHNTGKSGNSASKFFAS